MVIAPRGTELPARVTAGVLARHPVLLFEPGGNTRRIADAWFARSGVVLKPMMSLGSVEAIKALVTEGLGCAVLPQMAVRKEQAAGRLVVRPLVPKLQRRLAVVVLTCPPRSVPVQGNKIRATVRKRDAQEQVHRRTDHRVHPAG